MIHHPVVMTVCLSLLVLFSFVLGYDMGWQKRHEQQRLRDKIRESQEWYRDR